MNRLRSAFGLLCAMVLLAGTAFSSENLLVNGGFEQPASDSDAGVGKVPAGWSKDTLTGGEARGAGDSKSTFCKVDGGRTGEHAAALTLHKDDTWMYAQQWITLEQALMVYDDIFFTLAAKSAQAAEFDLYIEAWSTKTKKGATRRLRVKASGDWKTFTAKLPVTKDAEGLESFRVVVQLYTPGAELFVDDASVTRTSGALRRRAAKRLEAGKGVFAAGGEGLLHVDVDSTDLRITGSPITVQAWFRTTEARGVIFECGAQNRDPGPQAGYALYMKWGKIRFGVNNAVEMYQEELWDDATTEGAYNDGAWHHATGVFFGDGETRVKVYVDGDEAEGVKRAGQAQPALSAYSQTDPLARIGGQTDRIDYPEVAEAFWQGELADVRVWDRALSSDEIKANWAGRVDADAPGLVASWRFKKRELSPGDAVRDTVGASDGVVSTFTYANPIDDPFFPVDAHVFPVDDFDYSKYPSNITGYTGQNLQRIGFVTWEKARRRRVGPRGSYKAGFTQIPGGKLVLAACRKEADADFWAIDVYESGDRGDSWKRIDETPLFGKEPSLAALDDGTVILTSQGLGTRPDGVPPGTYTFRSRDGGRTWEELAVDEGDDPYPYPRNIIVDEDGSFLYLRTHGIDIETCRSGDRGDTWSFSVGKVDWDPKDMNALTLFAEIGVVRTADGRLLATLRREIPKTAGEGFEDTFLTDSTDDGKTWSRPWRASGTAEVHAYLTQLADGRLLMTYANYHLSYGPVAVVSEDGGKTWDRENAFQLAVSATCYAGWPVTLQLADGSLITSYATTIYAEKDPPTTVCEVVRWRLP